MRENNLLGAWGEDQAAAYLRRKGWTLLGLNYRCRFGEIDIIARKGRYLAFVEVKLRKSDRYGQAREFVTAAKQRRLMAAAELWLSQNPTDLQPRFDVIEVYAPRGMEGGVTVRHLENAFM